MQPARLRAAVVWFLLAFSARFAARQWIDLIDVFDGDAVFLGFDHGGQRPTHDVGKLIAPRRGAPSHALEVIPSAAPA